MSLKRWSAFNIFAPCTSMTRRKHWDSRVDRHDSIGKGFIGFPFFEKLMRDPRFDNMPLILETIDETLWPQEIAWLRKQSESK